MISYSDISIIIPAKNEANNLSSFLPKLASQCKDSEIIVINDGSEDDTEEVCKKHGVKVITHPYSKGNGAAIKTGARAATRKVIICMDGDGQHQPTDIPRLMQEYDKGYAMVVGARSKKSQANFARAIANGIYNTLASWMTEQTVLDLTSGFRIVNAKKFREFLYLLPNGFSYPTTITMAFFRAGYSVNYLPIVALKREGNSHISLSKDGVRFLLIIFKVGTLYSPLKLFFPLSLMHAVLGLSYYCYTYFAFHRFTNMSTVLFTTSIIIFLIGLISEQITLLVYKETSSPYNKNN
ncbi:MAG: glycosyltransferase family 2 protein [Pseudomonadales bacterium]|nr:glycosyltransferase family 2 protein [Pseudomonadales bacterium]